MKIEQIAMYAAIIALALYLLLIRPSSNLNNNCKDDEDCGKGKECHYDNNRRGKCSSRIRNCPGWSCDLVGGTCTAGYGYRCLNKPNRSCTKTPCWHKDKMVNNHLHYR